MEALNQVLRELRARYVELNPNSHAADRAAEWVWILGIAFRPARLLVAAILII